LWLSACLVRLPAGMLGNLWKACYRYEGLWLSYIVGEEERAWYVRLSFLSGDLEFWEDLALWDDLQLGSL
jgi:hypothetical protein